MSKDDWIIEPDIDETDTLNVREICPWCLGTVEWETYIMAGFSSAEDLPCPMCGNIVANIRNDMGQSVILQEKFTCKFFNNPKFRNVTKLKPLICEWCEHYVPAVVCNHEKDPKLFRRDPARLPKYLRKRMKDVKEKKLPPKKKAPKKVKKK